MSLLGVVCSVLVVAALGMVALWALPSLLARHPSQGMTAAQRLAAVSAIRTATVTFLLAVGAAGTVWFTARTYSLSHEGHVTDRYTSAVSQLGSDSPYVRVGGIYALERIGHDSPRDKTTIIYLLGAFIRDRSRTHPAHPPEMPDEDVLGALRVATRLAARSDVVLDLRGADLRNCDLAGLPKSQILLEGADVRDAQLPS
jgi:hypothetical protein